jgi:hypothetical protein
VAAWAWLAIMGGILALGGLALGGLALWRQYKRNTVLSLIGRREELMAARRSFVDVVGVLADSDNASLMRFETDRDDVNRRALADVAGQAALLRDELDTMPLPLEAVSGAEALADGAWYLECEVARLGGNQTVKEIRTSLDKVDLSEFDAAVRAADSSITAACTACRIEDRSVYGGGLYI